MYQQQIDGLRAIAVIAVIMYHAGIDSFAGGFIGVDVFFVISGYLISKIILTETKQKSFSIQNFYERRIRRIIPALYFVLFCSLPFAYVWLPPDQMRNYAEGITSSPVFLSNIIFALTDNYFNPEVKFNPLIHTWSLSIEAQFYIFLPILISLLYRYRKEYLISIISLIFLISILLSEFYSFDNKNFNFFNPLTRFWELLIGFFIALYLDLKMKLPKSGSIINEMGAILGFVLIIFSITNFNENTPFPGFYTLIPCIGAGLIIVFSKVDTFLGRILTNRYLSGIGLISYSAYLWHQPIFAFARQRSVDAISNFQILNLIILILILSYLSWRFIEIPFRDKTRFGHKKVFITIFFSGIFFILIGLWGFSSGGLPYRSTALINLDKIKTIESSRCLYIDGKTSEEIDRGEICTYGNINNLTFAVIGDSHAGAIFEALSEYAVIKNVGFYAFSSAFCAPLINNFILDKRVTNDCISTNHAAFKKIIDSKNITDVILYAEWPVYIKGNRDNGYGNIGPAFLVSDNDGASKSVTDNEEIFYRSLVKTVNILNEAGKNIIIISSTPEFHQPVMDSIKKYLWLGGSQSKVQEVAPKIKYQEFLIRNLEVNKIFKNMKNVTVFNSSTVFCDYSFCTSVDVDGNPFFSDTNHLTDVGARLLISKLVNNNELIQRKK